MYVYETTSISSNLSFIMHGFPVKLRTYIHNFASLNAYTSYLFIPNMETATMDIIFPICRYSQPIISGELLGELSPENSYVQ